MLLAESDATAMWTAVGSLAAVIGLIFPIMMLIYRQGQLGLKVDTMWSFYLRRGTSEAVHTGGATMNSPVTVTEQGKAWVLPLAPELRALYSDLSKKKLTDRDLAFEIEKVYGERLLKDVCIPNKISSGACLIAAVAVAKGNDVVDFDLPESPLLVKDAARDEMGREYPVAGKPKPV